MATKTFDELKQLAIQIRDEKTNKQNTATRIGTQMLEHLEKLEQDYYDKTTINNRTSEYNVSINHPTSGISGGNKYDLAGAIGQVPAELRTSGLTVGFLNESGDTEKWEFSGGSWAVGGFEQVGAERLVVLSNGCNIIRSNISLINNAIEVSYEEGDGYMSSLSDLSFGNFGKHRVYSGIPENKQIKINIIGNRGDGYCYLLTDIDDNIIESFRSGDFRYGYTFKKYDFITKLYASIQENATTEIEIGDNYPINKKIRELENTDKDIQLDLSKIKKSVGYYISLYKTEDGKYLNSEGVEVELSAYNIAYYNILQNISSIHVTARIGNSAYIVFFDANGNILNKYAGNDNSGINVASDFEVPSECATIGISYVKSYSCTVEALEEGIAKQIKDFGDKVNNISVEISTLKSEFDKGKDFISSLKGGKIGAVGDSIMSGASASTESERFINVFADLVGCTVNNVAIGGWTYMSETENNGFWQQVNGTGDATKSLDGDEDLIVISGLTNDFGHANPIGDYYRIVDNGAYKKRVSTEEQYRNSVCGGIHKLIKTLYDKYNGYIPIIICLPIHRVLGGSKSGGSWESNSLGLYIDDYCTAVRKVAEYYGIPVFDTFNMSGLNPNIDYINKQYFADGLHPKSNGHKIIGIGLYNFAKNLCIPCKIT